MRIVVPCDLEETKRRIRYGVRLESGPVVFELPMLLKEELRGNVEGTTFWVQCTRPHMVNFPQRYFSGTLEQEEDHTVIEGKFRHTWFYRGTALVLALCCALLGAVSFVGLLWGLFVLSIFSLGAWFSSVVYEKDEKAVVDFLNKL